jgi:hypothetical protein
MIQHLGVYKVLHYSYALHLEYAEALQELISDVVCDANSSVMLD